MTIESGPSRTQIYEVADLRPKTFLAVAERTAQAATFTDFVYRESEVDALWTLVDVELARAKRSNSPDLAKWQSVSVRLWEAHDLIPDGNVAESAQILRDIAATI